MHKALPMPAVVSFHAVGALLSAAPVPGIPMMVVRAAVGSSWVHILHIPQLFLCSMRVFIPLECSLHLLLPCPTTFVDFLWAFALRPAAALGGVVHMTPKLFDEL